MTERIADFLVNRGVAETLAADLAGVLVALAALAAAALAYFVAKRPLLGIIRVIAKKSKSRWADILFVRKVFDRLILLIPAIMLYFFAPAFGAGAAFVRGAAICLIVLAALLALDRLFDSVDDIYRGYELSKLRPIKGYLQVLKIGAYIIAAVLGVSALLDRSPALVLGGIGAATAVLLLIFQNSILGFVAGIQLTENDMLRIGDWIEMPGHGADGSVVDISLHTVKVQNWDKTITTIPTYSLVSESFRNWRAMQEAGGRRIKRSVYIDMSSVRFLDAELLDSLKKIQYIKEYLDGKTAEIAEYNSQNVTDSSCVVNGRHLTNLGTFRAYVSAYLRHNPRIRGDMTQLVRQLDPTEHGVPVEIYVFTGITDWEAYEGIQSDIFDHILSVVPEFGLRVFQNPSGHDLTRLGDAK